MRRPVHIGTLCIIDEAELLPSSAANRAFTKTSPKCPHQMMCAGISKLAYRRVARVEDALCQQARVRLLSPVSPISEFVTLEMLRHNNNFAPRTSCRAGVYC